MKMENIPSAEVQIGEVECTKAHVHTSECKRATHQCPFPGCGKIFMTKSVLDRHMRVHTGEKPYSCPVCGKTFSQLGNMTKHMKSHETAHLKWDRNTVAKPYKCTFPGCNSSFTAKTSLQSHMLTCHNIMPSSDLDISPSDDVVSVKRPLEKVVTIPDNATVKPTPSQCLHSGCNQVFNDQTELRKHLYSYSPGIHAEHEFLLNTVIHFADIITTWDNKSTLEKESVKAYALSVKQAVQKLKLEIDEKQKSFGKDQTVSAVSNFMNEHLEVKTQPDSTSIDSKSVVTHEDLMIPDNLQVSEGTDDSTIAKMLDNWVDNSPPPPAVSFAPPPPQATSDVSNTSNNYPPQQLFSNLLTAHDSITDGWRSHNINSHPNSHSHLHHHSYTAVHNPSPALLSNRFHQLGLVPTSNASYMYHSDPNHPPPAFTLPPTAMSWQQAIELSHDMMSGGNRGRPVLINPCSSAHRYKDFNFYEQSPAMIPVLSQGYSAENNNHANEQDYDGYEQVLKKMKTDNI